MIIFFFSFWEIILFIFFNLYKCCYCCNVFYRSMWVFFFQTVQKIQQMKVIIVAVYLILIKKVYTERMSNLPLNRLLYVCMYVIKNLTTFSQYFVGLLAFFFRPPFYATWVGYWIIIQHLSISIFHTTG